jgi:hypothetical protein
MGQGRHQLRQFGQTVDREPMVQRLRRPIGLANRNGDPAGGASLAEEDDLGARAAVLEDYRDALAGQRVVPVGDEDRGRNLARSGGAGSMRGPWVYLVSGACWCRASV